MDEGQLSSFKIKLPKTTKETKETYTDDELNRLHDVFASCKACASPRLVADAVCFSHGGPP